MCSNCECDGLAGKLDSSITSISGGNDQSALGRCRKCGLEPYIILDKVHIECKKCFLESCNKKIRSTIGKSKLIRNNDSVLIAYSGGPSSRALLDLINNSISTQSKREQKLIPSILHVDTQSIFYEQLNESTRIDRAHRLRALLSNLSQTNKGWPIYWTTLELATLTTGSSNHEDGFFLKFDPADDDRSFASQHLLNHQEAYDRLQKSLMVYKDLTDRQQYIQGLCDHLINEVAFEINLSLKDKQDQQLKYVFTGHSATQLANNLLVDVILGKGSTLRSTVSICDTRPLVPLVRPMRDFSKKEIAFYLNAREIDLTFLNRNLLTFASSDSSIQTVTESFLSKLYVDYPSTYSTLLRTGNKLQS